MSVTIQIPLTATPPPQVGITPTPHTLRTTVWDMIEYVQDFFGNDAGAEAQRVARRTIVAALRELANAANWSYYYTHGRLNTDGFVGVPPGPSASPPALTIQFQVSSGTYPNQVTLTGGTFPSWTPYGTIRFSPAAPANLPQQATFGGITYDIDRLISSTVCTLIANQAPTPGTNITGDAPAGTPFTLYRDTYTLPEDFVSMDESFADVSWGSMEYVHPTVWLRTLRYYQSYSNTPRYFTIMGDPKIPARMCLRIFPYPDSDRTLDFVYKRRPRKVTLDSYNTGKASVDAVNSPNTITGVNTAWNSSMVGSVLRLSADGTNMPGGWGGRETVAALERNITQVINANTLYVDDVATQSLTNVLYQISDPIDVENGAMLEAFFRLVEKHVAAQRKFKDRGDYAQAYQMALLKAREADSRVFQQRVAGVGGPYRQRMARMPMGPDVP